MRRRDTAHLQHNKGLVLRRVDHARLLLMVPRQAQRDRRRRQPTVLQAHPGSHHVDPAPRRLTRQE